MDEGLARRLDVDERADDLKGGELDRGVLRRGEHAHELGGAVRLHKLRHERRMMRLVSGEGLQAQRDVQNAASRVVSVEQGDDAGEAAKGGKGLLQLGVTRAQVGDCERRLNAQILVV